jgi:[ribosomal protein S5]-alanine N-acetyltransferase
MSSLADPFATRRLYFRLLRDDDLELVFRQFSDPEMCRYFSEPPIDRAEAKRTIEMFSDPDHKPFLRYGFFEHDSRAFVGTCGFHHLDAEARQAELGYDVWRGYWRQGFATEAVNALVDICFRQLDVDLLYVLIHPDNEGSLNTARKGGFHVCEPRRPLDEPGQVCMKLMRIDWERTRILRE